MSNETNNSEVYFVDTKSPFDCGNYTFDVASGNTTWQNDSCVEAATADISNMTCGKQEYFSSTYALVGTSVQGIIFLVGVLGNVLVCCVVFKSRSMHTTTNCYLVSLAVADTITLVASVPQEILSYHILGHRWVWGPVGCTLMIYLQYLGIDASALSLTAFTVERYIAICHPIKSKFICTLSRAKKVIVGCWIFAILYCSPWFFLTNTTTICVDGVGNITKCSFRLRRDSTEYLVLFFADLMLFYVYPLLLSIVLYLLIARALLSTSRNKFPGGRDDHRSKAAIKTNQSRVQVVKMLACVVFIFATLWVPYRGMLVYNTFNAGSPYMDLWFLMFAKTCIYMNCAINPILYNAMSDKFRKAFRTFLVCCRGRRRNAFGFVDDPVLVIKSSRQPTLCYRAQSALAVTGAVVGVVGRERHSLATTTLTTEAQIVHSEQGSESRRPTITTISIHSPTPGGSLGGSTTGNYLTVMANNGSRGNGGIPLNNFTTADSITLLPSDRDDDVTMNCSRGSTSRSRSSAVALALAASKISIVRDPADDVIAHVLSTPPISPLTQDDQWSSTAL